MMAIAVQATASNNKIIQNTINESDYGISIAAYSLDGYSTCNANADNNKITNNSLSTTSGTEGIFIGTGTFWGGTNTPTVVNNKVINNDITGFTTAISQSGDTATKVHANTTL